MDGPDDSTAATDPGPVGAPPGRPLSRREANKADKRRRIVAAGRLLFRTEGFEATTAAAIASAAGVGTGTFYLYASSKEELLVEVFQADIERAWGDAFALASAERPLPEQLAAVFGHVTRFHEGDPELARAFLKEVLFVSSAVRAGVNESMRFIFGGIADLVVRAQERGELETGVPPFQLARNLFYLWYPLQQLRHAGASTMAEAIERFDASLTVALRGLLRSGG
ncbi:MAG: TetR/AcrR family transcriptional regulator [Acidimicrobiia bacterium]|nr:TetR/AcrR family transcriptional regulator [Acidimicrobiia bacterium]